MSDFQVSVTLRTVICYRGHVYAYLGGTDASFRCPTCAGLQVKLLDERIKVLEHRIAGLKAAAKRKAKK